MIDLERDNDERRRREAELVQRRLKNDPLWKLLADAGVAIHEVIERVRKGERVPAKVHAKAIRKVCRARSLLETMDTDDIEGR